MRILSSEQSKPQDDVNKVLDMVSEGFSKVTATKWYSGKVAPDNDVGNKGDFYFNTTNSVCYEKGKNGWKSITSLRGKDGRDGRAGENGQNGWDAYELWVKQGNQGTVKDFLSSLQGVPGPKGDKGDKGDTGGKGSDGTDGKDGREIELRKNTTHIQWRYVGDSSWVNLVSLAELKGKPGVTQLIGGGGGSGIVQSVRAGTNVTVDSSDAANPVISATGGGSSTLPTQLITTEADYTVTQEDNSTILYFQLSGDFELIIPNGLTEGTSFWVANGGSGTLSINSGGISGSITTGHIVLISAVEGMTDIYASLDVTLDAGGAATWGQITGTLSGQTDLQSALDNKADDNAVVHTTGNESVAGDKTLTGNLFLATDSYQALTVADASFDTTLDFTLDKTNDWGFGANEVLFAPGGVTPPPGVSFINNATDTALLRVDTANNQVEFNAEVTGLSKADVELGNVDNTTDADKPVSTAQATADNLRVLKAGDTMTGNLIFSNSQKIIGGTSTTADLTLQTTSGVGTTGADMHFLVGNNGATEALTILNSGFIGAGTTSASYKMDIRTAGSIASQLHFASADTDTGGYLTSAGAGNFFASAGSAFDGANWIAKNTSAAILGGGPGNDGAITFYTNSGLTPGASYAVSERMRIDTSGRVGIGAASGAGLLEISKAISGTPGIAGSYINLPASTFTDNNTAASGTASVMSYNSILRPTLTATNSSVTTTAAISLYIENGPLAGTNQTITNSYALLVGGLGAGSVAIPAFSVRGDGRLSMNAVASSTNILNIGSTGGGGFSTTSTVTGIQIQTVNSGTGSILGHHTNPVSTASGTVAEMVGVRSTIRTANAGLTLTASKNFEVMSPTISSGAITTAYGLYINQQKITGVTTGYGVYQVNSADNNYFAGNVGIGQTTTTARLHLPAGTATANTAPLKFTSGPLNTAPVAGQVEYNDRFVVTESDAANRFVVQAAASTKTTAGAPYTNDGYVEVVINGSTVRLMTTT